MMHELAYSSDLDLAVGAEAFAFDAHGFSVVQQPIQ
jgi:hypothetical protein